MKDSTVLSLQTTEVDAKALKAMLDNEPGASCQATERKGVDGSVAAWIVVATLATQSLQPVLTFIKEMATRNKVKKIKFGDIEIENPTDEDLERIRKLWIDRTPPSKPDDD